MYLEQSLFSIGDWIVHVFYGLGQVIGRDKKVLEGEKLTFLRVKTFDSLYWIPIAKIDNNRVRPLASRNQFKYALAIFQKPPKKLSKDYHKRRKEIIQTLRTVSLYSKARMIRDLHGRRITSRFNFDENKVFKSLKAQFLDEWALVMDEDRMLLEMKLNKALEVSIENI